MMSDSQVTGLEMSKVDVEELVKELKVLNVDILTSYLKEIWRVKINYKLIILGFSSEE
jgi:hypothetical protein